MRTKKHPDPPLRRVSYEDWLAVGKLLHPEHPRELLFRCVRCGNEQSMTSVVERNPSACHLDTWIFFACEGRHTKGVGCDWSLGGLFRIHALEVVQEGEPEPIMCFDFARASILGERVHV